MASQVDLTLYEANDEKLNFTITSNIPGFSLVGKTVEVFVKPSASTADGDGAVWMGSTATGEVTVVDADEVYAEVPSAAVTLTKGWYRADVISSGLRKTAVYGELTIVDL